jgi:hypothetical protein
MINVSGCSKDGLQLGNVSGNVKINGELAPFLTVTFNPVAGGRASIGQTDAEGHYSLTYSTSAEGALVGPHKVSFIANKSAMMTPHLPENFSGKGSELAIKQAIREAADRAKKFKTIPRKYNEQTELVANVVQGNNELNFDLIY